MSYITQSLLLDIDKDVVAFLKTAFNTMDVMVSAGSSALSAGPIPPDTKPIIIDLPIFVNSATTQYAYTKIDAIKVPTDPVLSAYPGPCTMNFSAENNSVSSVSGISINECMIYAIANGIIKRLINDNKLLSNDNLSVPFKWYLQTYPTTVFFDPASDYPYWSSTTSAHVVDSNFNPLPLETYVQISIPSNVTISNIHGVNIIATANGTFYGVKDYYIQGSNIFVKLKTDYSVTPVDVDFVITLQYLYS